MLPLLYRVDQGEHLALVGGLIALRGVHLPAGAGKKLQISTRIVLGECCTDCVCTRVEVQNKGLSSVGVRKSGRFGQIIFELLERAFLLRLPLPLRGLLKQ